MSYYDIDEILDHYLECAIWSSDDDNGDPLDARRYDESSLTLASIAKARADIVAFCEQIGEIPESANLYPRASRNAMIGHDFWLTRNGHGCGFWDGDWSEPYATQLTKVSESFGAIHVWESGNNRHIFID